MDDFPSNTNREKAAKASKTRKDDEKKVEKVVTQSATQRKKPLSRRFAETFVGGDAKGVWSYVAMDVLVPAAKDTIADAFSQGIERMLFGEARSGSRRRGGSSGGNGFVNYSRYSKDDRRPESRELSRRGRSQFNFEEIVIQDRGEAEEVIDRLYDLVSQYNAATVADLYELVGITGRFTDAKWGWTDLRGAGVTRIRNGYLLDLPRPEELD